MLDSNPLMERQVLISILPLDWNEDILGWYEKVFIPEGFKDEAGLHRIRLAPVTLKHVNGITK